MKTTSFFSRILDIIAPRRCIGCQRRLLPEEEELCISCLLQFGRTYFWIDSRYNFLADMLRKKVDIEKAASWIFYASENGRHAIWALKYYGHDNAGNVIGYLMAKEMLPYGFFDDIDIIVPLPLAKNRERQRGYNQSLMLAKGISRATNIPIVNDALKRRRFKQSQTQISHLERAVNVKGQFVLVDDSQVKNSHVVVVDDVITTGSTVSSCIAPLARVEGIKISVLSLAFAGM